MARRPRLCERLFTAAERSYCEARADSAQHYAARFAAKEAVAKALGKSFPWREVEIGRGARGAPEVVFHGGAKAVAAGGMVQVSISHSGEYAMACALFEGS